MKKESSFKMKGFSGFGSPIQKKGILDIKFKDVKKNVTNKFKKVKEKIGNTTLRDVVKHSPSYRIYNKVKNSLNKNKNTEDLGNAVTNSLKTLESTGLMPKQLVKKKKRRTKKLIPRQDKPIKMPKIKVKQIPTREKRYDPTVKTFR